MTRYIYWLSEPFRSCREPRSLGAIHIQATGDNLIDEEDFSNSIYINMHDIAGRWPAMSPSEARAILICIVLS